MSVLVFPIARILFFTDGHRDANIWSQIVDPIAVAILGEWSPVD